MQLSANGLSYRRFGSGVPCLVPVGTGLPFAERTLARTLPRDVELIVVELRGSGGSAHDDVAALSMETLVADLATLRAELGLARPYLLGHSALGLVALAYAEQHPTACAGVALLGTPARLEGLQALSLQYWDALASPERKQLLAAKRAALAARDDGRWSPGERFVEEYVAYGPWYWFDAAYDSRPLWSGCAIDTRFVEHFFGTLLPRYLAAEHRPLDVPALIAHGVFDFSVPPLGWSGARERFTRLSYCAFEQSGHYPHVEEPARFEKIFLDWVAGT